MLNLRNLDSFSDDLSKRTVSAILERLNQLRSQNPQNEFSLLDESGFMVSEISSIGPLIVLTLLTNDGMEREKIVAPSMVSITIKKLK